MYRYLGIQNLPNGVITWVQTDIEDGSNALDDMIGSNIPINERGVLGEDAYLLQHGYVSGVVWEFFRSEITGRVGATQQLLDFLTQNGIKYIIH